jgi:hypothetical protein|uniref:Fe2OG dioxygenase domain-containing protein n=1 Tax=viral metagenome TaxID=1070528 RepID=A0A6C0FDK5_9ZZZZ|tara:strand:- start:38599 stop:39351 length:753 start_codon:yes stop_codon:yes gene_type:complete
MEFEEKKTTLKIMLDETTQTEEPEIEENIKITMKETKEEESEEDKIRIYNYSGDCWDNKYLSSHLLTTSYEAKLITNKLSFGMYSFHYFTDAFCDELVKDLKGFDGWTKDRHGNYPTNDVLLEEYNPNLHQIYSTCINNIVLPLINTVYEGSTFKKENFNHETFIVRYKPGVQSSLRLHHDSSTFSIILNLSQDGVDFEGGGTYFPQHEVLVKPPKGHLVIHPGKMTHWHGVRPITSGERYVIVSFCKDY